MVKTHSELDATGRSARGAVRSFSVAGLVVGVSESVAGDSGVSDAAFWTSAEAPPFVPAGVTTTEDVSGDV